MHKQRKALSEREVQRWRDGHCVSQGDSLVVEEPLELRAHGRSLAIIMRTPGHDQELARGLLHAEGLIRVGESTWSIRQDEDNVVVLEMDESLVQARWAERNMISSSACGVCGAAALAVLDELAAPIRSDLRWSPSLISSVPLQLRASQVVFAATGALHGAGLFDDKGALLASREDVGRHNAVDKVLGWALQEGRPTSECVLGVSGRLSYEIVHKAVAAGIPMVVAVSAPSSLAVDLGERWRVTLVGFARDAGFNVYSHAWRVQEPAEAG